MLFELEAQSTSTSVHASNTTHEMIESSTDVVRCISDGVASDADINLFLTRKVKIQEFDWAVGNDFEETFDPWALYFVNAAVKRKIENYSLFKGELKVSFLINGTPFHAGMLLASYRYLNSGRVTDSPTGDRLAITRSQRPHLWLNASTCKGGCLCLPFLYPQNFVSLVDPALHSHPIGRIDINSIVSLRQINAGNDTVTISIFAELVNYKLSAPTSIPVALSMPSHLSHIFDLEAQSDEYPSSGVISGPASTIANIAGALTSIPSIRPLAIATEFAANSIANFATFFGFSKPINLDDVKFMKNTPVGSLALCEGADSSQKLTVTGKQEISIDPATVDLPPIDELSLKHLTMIESYFDNFSWSVNDAQEDIIFGAKVTPMIELRRSLVSGREIIPTALSFAARPFENWSGTLIFRFQVVASQYHRGRIALVYEPKGNFSSTDPYNTTFNTIIDLAEGRDFSISIPWQQPYAYGVCDKDDTTVFSQSGGIAATDIHSNGAFYMRVVNQLVVPDGLTPATILVSVKAGPDLELINPTFEGMDLSPFVPVAQSQLSSLNNIFEIEAQSAVEVVPEEENAPESSTSIDVTGGTQITPLEKPLVYYGEKITSFRQLLKRYAPYRAYVGLPSGATFADSDMMRGRFNFQAMPGSLGFQPFSAFDTTTTGDPYNFVSANFINYAKGAYTGWRGSIRWKFLPVNSSLASMAVMRRESQVAREEAVPGGLLTSSSFDPGTTTPSSYARSALFHFDPALSGTAITQNRSMDSLEVEIPYALPLRFSSTSPEHLRVGQNNMGTSMPGGSAFQLTATTGVGSRNGMIAFDTYVAAGEDFTLFGFVGAPVMYSTPRPLTT